MGDRAMTDDEPALAIDRLRAGPRTPERVDAFFAGRSFPIVEGEAVTFVWRGAAEAVHLKHWIYGLPSSQPLARVDDTDVWAVTLELPAGSRVEYKLEVVRGGHGVWMEDPLNPMRARDPFGANSVAHAVGYSVPDWAVPDPEARRGRIEELRLDSARLGPRQLGLYLPARLRSTRRYPVVVVHDGHDYMRYAALQTVLDNLIHRLAIPELCAVLTTPGERLVEYADDARHAAFLHDELVPHLEAKLPLDPRPQARCLLGASFGAVAALSAAVRYPGFWGRLLLQSGSFAFTDVGDGNHRGPVFDPVVQFVNRFRSRPRAIAERVFVSCGMYESLIYENRSLVPVLQATGMEVRYVEARDGHNWENWRDRLREGLSWLLPGPFLMVYE
jgi:enterochelin esterase-like enzyme